MNARARFYHIAAQAIKDDLLTCEERDAISRHGLRKERYWARHLRDLQVWLAYRRGGER